MSYILFLFYWGEEHRERVLKMQSIFSTDPPLPFKRKKTSFLPSHQIGSQLVLTLASNHTRTFWVTSFSNSVLTSPDLFPLTHLTAVIKFPYNSVSQRLQLSEAELRSESKENKQKNIQWLQPAKEGSCWTPASTLGRWLSSCLANPATQ